MKQKIINIIHALDKWRSQRYRIKYVEPDLLKKLSNVPFTALSNEEKDAIKMQWGGTFWIIDGILFTNPSRMKVT